MKRRSFFKSLTAAGAAPALLGQQPAKGSYAFGPDQNMQLYNRGIRRRTAPMLNNDRKQLELTHSLILTLPGSPVLRNGDEIELNVESRKLELCVPDDELARRRKAWTPPPPVAKGGYQRLYVEHVLQADKGADLDFLVGCRGAEVPRESH